eukprot:SAG31_NODE_3660_length_4013_cov_3.345938_5_plen_108_part_00
MDGEGGGAGRDAGDNEGSRLQCDSFLLLLVSHGWQARWMWRLRARLLAQLRDDVGHSGVARDTQSARRDCTRATGGRACYAVARACRRRRRAAGTTPVQCTHYGCSS